MVEMQELDSLSYVWEGSSVQVKVCGDKIHALRTQIVDEDLALLINGGY